MGVRVWEFVSVWVDEVDGVDECMSGWSFGSYGVCG